MGNSSGMALADLQRVDTCLIKLTVGRAGKPGHGVESSPADFSEPFVQANL
jgi:hypothetical protein